VLECVGGVTIRAWGVGCSDAGKMSSMSGLAVWIVTSSIAAIDLEGECGKDVVAQPQRTGARAFAVYRDATKHKKRYNGRMLHPTASPPLILVTTSLTHAGSVKSSWSTEGVGTDAVATATTANRGEIGVME